MKILDNPKHCRTFKVTYPDNKTEFIYSLSDFKLKNKDNLNNLDIKPIPRYKIYSPLGEIYTGYSLKKCAEILGLPRRHLDDTRTGRKRHYKGWVVEDILIPNRYEKPYRLLKDLAVYKLNYVNGKVRYIRNLEAFIRTNKYSFQVKKLVNKKDHFYNSLFSIVKLEKSELPNENLIETFQSLSSVIWYVYTPENKELVIENLKNFCREYNLSYGTLLKGRISKGYKALRAREN